MFKALSASFGAAAAIAFVGLAVPAEGHAQEVYVIQSELDGLCLDADATEPPNKEGGRVQMWECNGWLNQRWKWLRDPLYSRAGLLRNEYSHTCIHIDLANYDTPDGDRVYQIDGSHASLQTCRGGYEQTWRRDARFDVTDLKWTAGDPPWGPGVLDYDHWTRGNGGKVQLWTPLAPLQPNQRWRFTRVD